MPKIQFHILWKIKFMAYFHYTNVIYDQFEVKWHEFRENIGQVINHDATTNTQSKVST